MMTNYGLGRRDQMEAQNIHGLPVGSISADPMLAPIPSQHIAVRVSKRFNTLAGRQVLEKTTTYHAKACPSNCRRRFC